MDRSVVMATKIRAAFAPCSLGDWPTPLEAQPGLAHAVGLDALWLKREDHAGGNKVRGLEFLFAGVPARSVFVSIGGTGSRHYLTTPRFARAQGHRTAIALFDQPATDASRRIAVATVATADVVVRAHNPLTLPRAVLGHFLATLELELQVDAPPDAIIVPLGTGGTAAGIALGVAWLGWPTQVVAMRVAPRIVANSWRTMRLARHAAALLRRAGVGFDVPRSSLRVRIVNAMGPGYGYPTPDGERARTLAAEHGLQLDPTYGAKAFSFFLRQSTGKVKRGVFWQTFPSS